MKRLLPLALVLLFACEPDQNPVQPVDVPDPVTALSITGRGGVPSNPGFSWLSPIVKDAASVDGEFDPSFLPFIYGISTIVILKTEPDGNACTFLIKRKLCKY